MLFQQALNLRVKVGFLLLSPELVEFSLFVAKAGLNSLHALRLELKLLLVEAQIGLALADRIFKVKLAS